MRASVIIEEICNKAADAAIKRFKEKEREEKKKGRLRNTELLLKNYNSFKDHLEYSIDSITDLSDKNDLGGMDEEELFVWSIRRSKCRTLIMIAHIDAALERLKIKMIGKGQIEKYNVLKLIFINEKTYEVVAEENNCSEITARRWKNEMINELSLLLFGSDGIKIDY